MQYMEKDDEGVGLNMLMSCKIGKIPPVVYIGLEMILSNSRSVSILFDSKGFVVPTGVLHPTPVSLQSVHPSFVSYHIARVTLESVPCAAEAGTANPANVKRSKTVSNSSSAKGLLLSISFTSPIFDIGACTNGISPSFPPRPSNITSFSPSPSPSPPPSPVIGPAP